MLATGTVAQASYSAIWFGVAVLAPTLRDRYHLGLGETGFLIAAPLVGSIVSLIPWGVLADRIGERPVLGLGLALCAAALLGAGEVSRFWALAGLLVAAGCAGASVQSASGRAVMRWFPPARRGLALGIRQTAIPLGGFAVALTLPHLSAAWAFRTLGITCAAAAAAGIAVVREGPIPIGDDVGGALDISPFRDRRIWALSWGSSLLLWPQMCLVGFTVLFLHDRRDITTGHAAAVLAAIQVLGVIGRVATGAWSDAVRTRVGPLRLIALLLVLLTLATAALVDAPLAVLVLALVLTGGLAMSWNGLAFTAAAELAGGTRAGAAIGLQQTVINTTAAALPPAFGALVGATGWAIAFALVAPGPLGAFLVFRGLDGRA